MRYEYDDGGRRAAGYKTQTGDCVTRSVAIASGRPYQEVFDAMTRGNQTERCAERQDRKKDASKGVHTTRVWFKRYMLSLGFTWTPTMKMGSGCRVHLRDGELPMGRLVVYVSRHLTAVVDGVIRDSHEPDRGGSRCVYGYWRLNPIDP